MAAFLALVPAMCFALAAALQQRGRFALAVAGSAGRGLGGPVRLPAVPVRCPAPPRTALADETFR